MNQPPSITAVLVSLDILNDCFTILFQSGNPSEN